MISSDDEDDDFMLMSAAAVVVQAAAIASAEEEDNQGRQRLEGAKTVKRTRRDPVVIFDEMGVIGFRRAYRMHRRTFIDLFEKVEPFMRADDNKRKRGATPNGPITKLCRFSMAIRFFAGGDRYDIGPVFGVSSNEVYRSVWRVVDAIHKNSSFDIEFPKDHDKQREIALGFKAKSKVNFDNCVGCIDGMLVWTNKPVETLEDIGVGPAKFYCGRKNKFGLNMQAVCDHKRRFLDVDITHPGSASDFTVWLNCKLRDAVETQNFLAKDLVLYGDNAYVNTPYMVTPFRGVSSGPKDDYNYYHSSTRITIEGAFGSLVHRWGCLRKPMPVNFAVSKISALVTVLCKLHNFCINADDISAPATTSADGLNIALEGGIISLNGLSSNVMPRVHDLLDAGDFVDPMHVQLRKQRQDNSELPVQRMLSYIEQHGFQRPAENRRS
jgi:hypothetical protein